MLGNMNSKKPSRLARIIAPVYRIFRSSGSQNSVEVVEPQEVAGGVTMFGSAHTEVLKATREVRLRKTADNSEKLSSPASQATLTSMKENTDLDGLDLEPLGVDDTDVVTIDKELDLLQGRTKKLSETASGFNRLAAEFAERESSLPLFDRFKGLFSRGKKESEQVKLTGGSQAGFDDFSFKPFEVDDSVTTEEKPDTLKGNSEKLSASASELSLNAKKLAEQFKEESNSFTGMFKGWFSKNKKQSDTESEYDEKSVSDESSLDHKTASKPWYRKGALGSTVNWLQLIGRRKGYNVIPGYDSASESQTRELVQEDHEFTSSILDLHFDDISLRSESADMTIESHLDRVNLESGDTPGFMPELSEKEKIGLVQRMKNTLKTIGDCFMSLFRTTEVVDEDRVSISSRGSFTYLDGRTFQTRAETPPPSYDAATQGQTNSWTKRFSSKGTSGSFEERLKERTAVDAKGVIYTDL